ncbi:anti-sigma-F factor Fin family protein [Pontibacillus litoralis]|uniref:Peptide ABC transporter permease n=1 Tax=Pontibacillus litoralis JSM 072002 TaxID=1385512 RepID=A0A0A5FXA0_9BACI|nr:anti-sigma-F factor Fin family protein [Pontibacillus litoralis]KGX85481.1 hypothetical protein N784_09000 [Pontibacillus litoralis JSM 072002]
MAIVYQCRHCKQRLAALAHEQVNANDLGLQHLSEQERLEMIQLHENGDMQVNTICEHCQEAIELHPHYHELESFLQ